MPSKHNLSVSLTEHLCSFVDAQIATGSFRSASEVVRAGLRLLERDLAQAAPADGVNPAAAVGDKVDRAVPPRRMP
jgi:antitoxin ParD1/3/4